MLFHEGRIDLLVAGGAGGLIEPADIAPMAVVAGEACPSLVQVVPLQGKPDRLVGEALQVHHRQGCPETSVVGVALEAFPGLALSQHDTVEVVCA